jgi:hypothetical protein
MSSSSERSINQHSNLTAQHVIDSYPYVTGFLDVEWNRRLWIERIRVVGLEAKARWDFSRLSREASDSRLTQLFGGRNPIARKTKEGVTHVIASLRTV